MKRRDFLGALAAGATLASLPVSAITTPDPIIWNAETLAARLEAMFACRVGPATGFYEVLASTGQLIKPNDKLPEGAMVNRYIYETYVCAVEGGSAQDAEARLAKHFYDEFSKVPAGSLVWRLKPHFQSDEVTEYGDTYLTHEQVEDEAWKFTAVGEEHAVGQNHEYQITQFKGKRVKYDEHAELVLPPNVEYHFESGGYKYVERKYTLHKMRMRLVLPESYRGEEDLTIQSLSRKEGGVPVRI